MEFWTFVTIATVVGCSIPLAGIYSQHRLKMARARDQGGALHEEVTALRERVGVLEEIVTDRRYQLSDSIEQLEQTDATPARVRKERPERTH